MLSRGIRRKKPLDNTLSGVVWQICRCYAIEKQVQNNFKEILLIAENFGESRSNLHAFHLEYDYRGCTVCYL